MIYAFLKALKSRNTYQKAIQSLVDQVDHIYLAIDEETDYTHPKVTLFVTGNENADLDKILILKEVKIKHNDHIFICDDDLIYPEDYVKYTLSKKKPIASYGGSFISNLPIASYYQEKETIDIWHRTDYKEYVQIPFSGLFYFRATKSLVEALSVQSDMYLPFACDLSIAGLLGALNLKCAYISPKEDGWFKHIEMDMSCTIYESFKNKDFEQTLYVNKHNLVWEKEIEYPSISVVFVVTRIKYQRDIVMEALKSLKNQIYPNYEIVWIENYDKMKTIGKCFNEGVQQATGDWILFFADDDIIMPDYLASIAGAIMGVEEDIVCITSNIIMFNEQEEKKMEKAPTGCWKREFLLEEPFVEWANRFVDTEMFERARKKEKDFVILRHNYGYLYRSHGGQASGMKTLDESASDDNHFAKMNKIMKETFG